MARLLACLCVLQMDSLRTASTGSVKALRLKTSQISLIATLSCLFTHNFVFICVRLVVFSVTAKNMFQFSELLVSFLRVLACRIQKWHIHVLFKVFTTISVSTL